MKKSNLVKKLFSFVLVFVLSFSLAGCGNPESGTDNSGSTADGTSIEKDSGSGVDTTSVETVRAGITTGLIDHYIALIGIDQGIFEKNGIDLSLTEFVAGINTVDAVVSNQVDIGKVADFAIINRIGNTKKEFNAKIIGRFESAATYNLYVNSDKVSDLADLKGQGVASVKGTILDYFNALMYKKAGIGEADQNIVNVDSGQVALSVMEKGDAVAFWASGDTAKQLEKKGYVQFLKMADIDANVDDYYIASDEYLAEHKETVVNFLKASYEAEQWIMENEDEAARIIANKISVDEEQIKANIEATTMLMDFSGETLEHLEDIEAFAAENGLYDGSFEVKDFIDTAPLAQAVPDADIFTSTK